MNKYQKIALILGLIIILIIFGKTLTRLSFGIIGLFGKGLIIVAATVLLIYSLKKGKKRG